jgi:uncharacterized protein (DUF488 family)
MNQLKLFTIGFTKKSAQAFFSLLNSTSAKTLIDVRLNNISQLAGFAKSKDLAYFLEEICEMNYLHLPELAPTKDILDDYKKNGGDWEKYEDKFLNLLDQRAIEKDLEISAINDSCLLCSEHEPHFCHRRLVAEYLNLKWDCEIEIKHLF